MTAACLDAIALAQLLELKRQWLSRVFATQVTWDIDADGIATYLDASGDALARFEIRNFALRELF